MRATFHAEFDLRVDVEHAAGTYGAPRYAASLRLVPPPGDPLGPILTADPEFIAAFLVGTRLRRPIVHVTLEAVDPGPDPALAAFVPTIGLSASSIAQAEEFETALQQIAQAIGRSVDDVRSRILTRLVGLPVAPVRWTSQLSARVCGSDDPAAEFEAAIAS
jgi:hypothetical protein